MEITDKYNYIIQKASPSPTQLPLTPKADSGQAYARKIGNDNDNGWFDLYRTMVNNHAAVNRR